MRVLLLCAAIPVLWLASGTSKVNASGESTLVVDGRVTVGDARVPNFFTAEMHVEARPGQPTSIVISTNSVTGIRCDGLGDEIDAPITLSRMAIRGSGRCQAFTGSFTIQFDFEMTLQLTGTTHPRIRTERVDSDHDGTWDRLDLVSTRHATGSGPFDGLQIAVTEPGGLSIERREVVVAR
jgi:hypothetical protein